MTTNDEVRPDTIIILYRPGSSLSQLHTDNIVLATCACRAIVNSSNYIKLSCNVYLKIPLL